MTPDSLPQNNLELLDSISDGFFLLDYDLMVLFFNHEAERLLGRNREDVLGHQLFDAFPEARGSVFEERYTHAATHREFLNFEVFFGVEPYANWYEVRVHPLPDSIAVFFLVTTERKRAEIELRRERDFSRLLMETAPVAMTVVDSEGNIVFANSQALQQLRLTKSEVTARTYDDPKWRITAVDGSPFPEEELPFAVVRRYLRPVQDIRHALILPDDSRLVLSIYGTPLLTDDGAFNGALFACEDITASTAMEQALKESEALYRNLIKFMPHGLEEVAVDGRILFSNDSFHRMLGLPPGSIVGKFIWELTYDPIEAAELKAYFLELIKGKTAPTPYVTTYVTPDGKHRIHQVDWDYKRTPTGEVDGFIAVITDITEQRRSQEMMILTEKMMSIAGLAAGMAHEINNPLAAVLGGLQNLSRRLSPDSSRTLEKARTHGVNIDGLRAWLQDLDIPGIIDSSRDAALRAARIVSNMLDFSRRKEGAVSTCDLGKLLDNALELARSDYDMKKLYDFRKIDIHIQGLDEPLNIDCNSTELEQVFLNLFKNAAQAMGEMKHKDHAPRITIRVHKDRTHLTIDVEDNGPGIDESIQRNIFEPFFTTKASSQGSGLGLAVSYFIITQNHNGEFLVSSRPGHGACFTIRIPFEQPSLSTA